MPTNDSMASSKFPSVADTPHVRIRGLSLRSRASASSVWMPRLVPSNSCHSSTITASNRPVVRATFHESTSTKDFRVWSPAPWASRFSCRAFALALLSPVRDLETPRQSESIERRAKRRFGVASQGTQRRDPKDCAAAAGVSDSTWCGLRFSLSHCRIGPIQTASVLPVPVAECTSPLHRLSRLARPSAESETASNQPIQNSVRFRQRFRATGRSDQLRGLGA